MTEFVGEEDEGGQEIRKGGGQCNEGGRHEGTPGLGNSTMLSSTFHVAKLIKSGQ